MHWVFIVQLIVVPQVSLSNAGPIVDHQYLATPNPNKKQTICTEPVFDRWKPKEFGSCKNNRVIPSIPAFQVISWNPRRHRVPHLEILEVINHFMAG